MNNKISDALTLILPVATVVITTFADTQDKITKWILLSVLIVIAIIFFILSTLKGNKNLTDTQVLDKSRRYTKHLIKLVKTNARVMKKDFNASELKETDKKIKEVTQKINHSYTDNRQTELDKLVAEKNFLLDKFYDKQHGYVDAKMLNANKPTNKMVSLGTYKESQIVFDLIYDTVKDMERILLQLGQHQLRIKLGRYVIKYSTDIDKSIHAYVDYLGWTHVLLGNNKKGFEAIQNGLHLIDYKININKSGHDKYCELKEKGEEISPLLLKAHSEYCEYVLQKARALRHLGTTYYTYRSFKDNFVKENYKKEEINKKCPWDFDNTVNPYVKYKLAEGLALMQEKSVIEYFNETPSKRKTYAKMVFGIKYNDLLYDYYVAVYKNIQSIETYIQFKNQLDELISEIDKADFDDNHRLIKILTLKNQINHKIYNQQDDSGIIIEGSDTWDNVLEKDLKTIEKVLNENIYFDEAMEVYVCQKIRMLYTNIEKVFENKK